MENEARASLNDTKDKLDIKFGLIKFAYRLLEYIDVERCMCNRNKSKVASNW